MPGAQPLRSDRRTSSRDDPGPAVVSRSRTLAAEVLRLQRSAGNAAVGRLLARCPDGSDPNCDCHPRKRRIGELEELLAASAGPRRLARQPEPPPERLPPNTGPKQGDPPEKTGCSFGWKDGEWVYSCEHDGMSTPDIPADPRKIPGKFGDLIPKDKGRKPGDWPFPSPDQGPWLKPPPSVEEICRNNPLSPVCINVPPPKKSGPLLPPVGLFYSFDVLFEHNLPAKKPEGGMTAAGASMLEWVVEHLQADPTLQVRLVGHASSEGTAAQNMQLSMRRARAVNAALAAKGLGARVMDFVGGEDPAGCKRLEFGIWACGATQAATDRILAEDRKVAVTFLRNAPPRPGPLELETRWRR
jgi:OmpA family